MPLRCRDSLPHPACRPPIAGPRRAAHRSGQAAVAEALYLQIMQEAPDHLTAAICSEY